MPEARATAALNHPHIATLYDVGPDYLVTEFVEGETLRGPLPLARALLYAGQIPGRAGCSHRKGIVHRDLKPANVMASALGKNDPFVLGYRRRRTPRSCEGSGGLPQWCRCEFRPVRNRFFRA